MATAPIDVPASVSLAARDMLRRYNLYSSTDEKENEAKWLD